MRAEAPKPKGSKRFGWVAAGLFALGGLTLGGLVGGSGDTTATMPSPMPAATVTTTASAEPVEKTPQSCLDALDYADQGFEYAAKVLGYVEDAINAILSYDVARINRITDKVNGVSEKMGDLSPKYNAAKTDCRAGA